VKAHILTVMVIDFDELGEEDVKSALENTKYPNWCIYPRVVRCRTEDIGEWSDDHPLNQSGTDVKEYFEL